MLRLSKHGRSKVPGGIDIARLGKPTYTKSIKRVTLK